MNEFFNWDFNYPSQRMPILANNIVSTSQPLASQAGLRMILKGGNAVDAAISAAISLAVVEPTMNGIGSDAFAILWDGKQIVGLNASGRSPAAWVPEHFSHRKSMPFVGWDSVTVPGAVSAWVELSKKYGRLSFNELFEPAINYAEKGFLVSPITAQGWQLALNSYNASIPNFKDTFPDFYDAFFPNGKAPKPGTLFRFPAQANTLRLIAETDGDTFYYGNLAKKIIAYSDKTGGTLTLEDLEKHKATWEKSLSIDFNDVTLHEMPPNGQGLAALIMLGILNYWEISSYEPDSPKSIHLQIEAMKLAFADAYRYISDPQTLEFEPINLLSPEYLKKRANLIHLTKANKVSAGIPKNGDTVYLTAADSEGMMVSYIQSNYGGFGSCIVVPGTGISLQNRGNGFSLVEGHPNQVGPRKRPFHTIIPAFVTRKGKPLMSYGVMGGAMQPQGHTQMMIRIFEYGQNPQTALDAPRWRFAKNLHIYLESGVQQETFKGLTQLGHHVSNADYTNFGGGQIIFKLEDGYLGASDWRKDGQTVGF
ncbi:MAG: gamma-glutamyltransferase family protein [Promethearchaeota archaeon]